VLRCKVYKQRDRASACLETTVALVLYFYVFADKLQLHEPEHQSWIAHVSICAALRLTMISTMDVKISLAKNRTCTKMEKSDVDDCDNKNALARYDRQRKQKRQHRHLDVLC